MTCDLFNKHLSILVGLGFPIEINTVQHAYQYLLELPPSLRDSTHHITLQACVAALRGEIESETARSLFAAFSERHNLLVTEAPASYSAQRSSPKYRVVH